MTYDNGDPVQCFGPSTFWMDAHAEYKPTSFLTLYGDVLNVFNRKPGIDVNAGYSIYQFNPAWQIACSWVVTSGSAHGLTWIRVRRCRLRT